MKLPGIYVEIKGDYTELEKNLKAAKALVTSQATGISDAINNALSPDKLRGGLDSLVKNLSQLDRASKVPAQNLRNISAEMGELRKITGLTEKEWASLQGRFLSNQTSSAQENSLKRIASLAGLTEGEIRKMGQQFGLSAEQIDKVVGANGKAEKSFLSLGLVAKAAIAYLSAGAISAGVRDLVATADAYTSVESKLRLVTKGESELQELQNQLYASANNVRSALTDHADMYARVARSMADYNLNQQQTLAFSEAIAQSMVISGATTQEAASFAIQFSQAMQKGTLNGDEFRAVTESNGRAVKVLTDYLGVSVGELRNLSTEGKITADVLYNAFSKSADQLRGEFNSMKMTVGQSLTHLKNAYGSLVDGTNDSTGATSALVSKIEGLSRIVENNKPEIIGLFTGIATAAGVAAETILNITNSVKGWSAVAAGVLNFSDFATMNSSDLKQWMRDFDEGTAGIKKQVREVREELAGLSDAMPGVAPKRAELTLKLRGLEAQLSESQAALAKKAQQNLTISPAAMGTVNKPVSQMMAEEQEKLIKGREKFLKEIQTQQEALDAWFAELKPFAKSDDELARLTAEYNQRKEAIGAKGVSLGLKGERSALKELNAEITGYTAEARLAAESGIEWHRATLDALDGIERLNEEISMSTMGDFGHISYESARLLKEGALEVEKYQKSLAESEAKLNSVGAARDLAVARLAEAKAALSGNAAGSDTQDANKVRALEGEIRDLDKAIKLITIDHRNLGEAQQLAVTKTEQLKDAIGDVTAYKTNMQVFQELGLVSQGFYDKLEKLAEREKEVFIANGGDKDLADRLFFERALERRKALAAGEYNKDGSISGLISVGISDSMLSVQREAISFYADALPSAINESAGSFAEFFRNVAQGNKSIAESWKDLGKSVENVVFDMMQDLLKLQLKMAVMGIGQSLFGSPAGSSSSVSATGKGYSVPGVTPGFHSGGTIGVDSPTFTRSLPDSIFAGARRFHSGLLSDEYPAILQRGESVLTEGQMAAIGKGLRSGNDSPIVINVIESPGNGGQVNQSRGSNGENIIDVFVDRVKSAVAGDIVSGNGAVPNALQVTYGLNRSIGGF